MSKIEANKARSRLEIVADLLDVARTPVLKTHLMYRGNLSYFMVSYYTRYLNEIGLMSESIDPKSTAKYYQTTPEGFKYLEIFDSFAQILNSSGSQNNRLENPIIVREP